LCSLFPVHPLPPLSSAKYLVSFFTPSSSSVPDVNYRCSQASSAFRILDPFFRHLLVSPKFKLRVYSQIVQSILLHGSESQIYSPAHYKALRQIFQVKSPYYHRVLQPSDSPCSNTYLFPCPTRSFPHAYPPRWKFQIPVSNCSDISCATHPLLNPLFVLTSPILYVQYPPLLDAEHQEPIGQSLH